MTAGSVKETRFENHSVLRRWLSAVFTRGQALKRLDYIDINGDRVLLDALGVSFLVAQRRLHLLTRNGLLLDGAYAFAAVWRELPYYRRLADALYKLRLLPALDRLYDRFAALRFRHRCPAGACHGRA